MKRTHRLLLTLLVTVAAVSSAVAGEVYRFDQAHSTIGFSVHQYLGTTHGKFTKFNGRIELDREHPEKSSVVATIQVASIDTGIAKRDNHLRSPEFFNVEKFPEMTFKSRSAKQTSPQAGDIAGDLTMHGVTKPIILHVKLVTAAADTKHTHWTVTTDPLKRGDFSLMFASAAETMSGISQTVQINIEIEAQRAQ